MKTTTLINEIIESIEKLVHNIIKLYFVSSIKQVRDNFPRKIFIYYIAQCRISI